MNDMNVPNCDSAKDSAPAPQDVLESLAGHLSGLPPELRNELAELGLL